MLKLFGNQSPVTGKFRYGRVPFQMLGQQAALKPLKASAPRSM